MSGDDARKRALEESMFRDVVWEPTGLVHESGGEPVATLAGTISLAGETLRVYTLSDGRRIVHGDDMARVFGVGVAERARGGTFRSPE